MIINHALINNFYFLQDSKKDSSHVCYRLSSTERIVIQGQGTLGYLNNFRNIFLLTVSLVTG